MIRDGGRDEQSSPPRQRTTQAELDILHIRPERLVQAAQVAKKLPSKDCSRHGSNTDGPRPVPSRPIGSPRPTSAGAAAARNLIEGSVHQLVIGSLKNLARSER